ncbi:MULTISPECIES: WD40 repeat domain-containing protein [Microcystis]|uniref:WD-40 repeat protein n=1 Tax=Microcystis panniformis FACHB-1757 TaxID=1638788 RepID=A0A0K1S6H1_9CHRO|nr:MULTISPECIES: hypothetical protein [Microcystis]AKV69591.1 WD-40 repeat protein [Microcystis panniformis FACHB-1757]
MFNPLVSFKSLEGHEGEVKCLTFSQDGQFLASGDNELTVIVWDWQKNQKFSLQGHEKAGWWDKGINSDRGTSQLKSLCSMEYRHRLQKKISHIYHI